MPQRPQSQTGTSTLEATVKVDAVGQTQPSQPSPHHEVTRKVDAPQAGLEQSDGASASDAAIAGQSDYDELWDDGYDPLIHRRIANGQYELIHRLGVGGMGAVYEGRGDDGTTIAAKVIRPGVADADAMRRIVREARAATAVRHPNVIRVDGIIMDGGLKTPIILMELLHGSDLSELITRVGPLKPVLTARIFYQAALGFQAAHELGIIHRDIKPANIYLHKEKTGKVTVKVCDFGVAKLGDALRGASGDITNSGGILGSPAYMAPEQMRDSKRVSAQSDIWSVSVALWQTLAGRLPWKSTGSFSELMLEVFTKEIPHLATVAPWVDKDLADVVHRGLQKDTDRRYASMNELAEALKPFMQDTPELTDEELRSAGVPNARARSIRPAAPDVETLADHATSLNATTVPNRPQKTSPPWYWLAAALVIVVPIGLFIASQQKDKTTNNNTSSPAAMTSDASHRQTSEPAALPALSAAASASGATSGAPPTADAPVASASKTAQGSGQSKTTDSSKKKTESDTPNKPEQPAAKPASNPSLKIEKDWN